MVGAGRFRQGLGAAFAACLLAAVSGSVAPPAPGAPLDDLLPHLHTRPTVEPTPIPVPSEGRIPVSLRLADSISLTYLGLRFRKGLFSAACPKRRLQSRVTNTFADGTRLGGGLITTC